MTESHLADQTAQATLTEFNDDVEWTTEEFTKTVIFDLKQPTKRKRDRLDAAIESATDVQVEAARRMPSVPKRYWGSAQPKNSIWYGWAKTMDSHLSNKTVLENIQRVREAFNSWKKRDYDGSRPAVERFADGTRCAFDHEQPQYKVDDVDGDSYYVTLPLAAGRGEREWLPLRDGEYLREHADAIRDGTYSTRRAEVIRDNGEYRLHQVVKTDIDVIANPKTHVGVDIGLTNLAVAGAVAEGGKVGAELWSGSQAAEMRSRFLERKRQAQSEGLYEQLRDEEARYIEHVCHTISRELIDWALEYDRPKIVLEDLTDIRDQFIRREREHTADERRALHSWPFQKLQGMIEYKATEAGLPVESVDPEYTSQACNECGYRDEDNRSTAHFECIECGYEVNADVNAAFNIASEAVASAN